MAYRPLDFQMSVPRTPDVSSLQSQMMNKPIVEQTKLADEAAKQIEKQRHTSTKVDDTTGLIVQDEQTSKGGQQGKRNKQQQSEQEQSEGLSTHPYKGKHIDISL